MSNNKFNFIFIILDGCRYDAFKQAHTPNFDSIGELHKCYSPAHWSILSIIHYFLGEAPLGTPSPGLRQNLLDYRWDNRDDTKNLKQPDKFCGYYLPDWYDGFYEILDYHDILWNHFKFDKIFVAKGHPFRESETIFKEIIKDINEREEKGFRIFAHLDETRIPFGFKTEIISKASIKFNILAMQKGIQIADRNFKFILNNLHEPTRIIITSDHGQLMNEIVDGRRYAGHGASMGRVEFHDKLFEIPLIVGDYK